MKTLCIVDGNAKTAKQAMSILNKHYHVMPMKSAAELFSLLEIQPPDMILLNEHLPDMSGLETLRTLKSLALFTKIPVIIVSSSQTSEIDEGDYFFEGAADYIRRPCSAKAFLGRVQARLKTNGQELLRARRFQDLQNGIMVVLADVIDQRDHTTGSHVLRTSAYIKILTAEMMRRGVYADETRDWTPEMLIPSARLHDVGKITVPDSILNKPGKLTKEEFDVIKKHTTEGEHIIEMMVEHAGGGAFLSHAKVFAGAHHEWWNGSGYPYGLKGTDIPLEGRVLAIADVYDALISERPYKPAFSNAEAERIILEEAGTHFDPLLVNIFYDIREQFRTVELLV